MPETESRPPECSRVEMTQLVLPGDANTLGNAFGGKILQWIDIAAGVAARRHCGGVAVTASIDSVQFKQPVLLGDVVVLRSQLTRAWRTSMEIYVSVDCDGVDGADDRHAVSAFLTFVAIDGEGRPRPVPAISPQTDREREAYRRAEERRTQRLRSKELNSGGDTKGGNDT